MIRPLAILAALALSVGAASAQQAAPAPAAAPPQIVVDPAASLNTSPKQANMLTGFYATQAVIELCAVTLDPAIIEGMAADRARLELALGLDAARAADGYARVKADVEKTQPDCADGSADRLSVDAVVSIYAALPPPAATPAAAAPAVEAPAVPAAQ